ncbi:MAG TPA: penicillin acylase family protein [Vicinamibacterales bacterium]|nr:penicillin acylase family protein [Vicinamibacterales bacterium]
MLKQSKGWIARAVLIVVTTLPVCVLAQDTTVRDTESDDRRRKSRNNGRVLRDSDGIPHIAARTEREVIYLQGFTHAQDRLFQMDVTRRQAEGTLAELLGAGALASDVQLRTFGLRRAAEHSLPILSQNVRNALSAYADGVNDYVARNSLPPEYAALEITTFRPWAPVDSLSVLKLIGFGLSFELTDLDRTTLLAQYQAAGAARGFDGAALFFEDVSRLAPFDNAATLARDYLANLGSLPFVQAALRNPDDERGSNEFVISGQHSRTGSPILANDPHLELTAPAIIASVPRTHPRLAVRSVRQLERRIRALTAWFRYRCCSRRCLDGSSESNAM